jgi:acetyl-CoA carboxylase carboxyltransferase component
MPRGGAYPARVSAAEQLDEPPVESSGDPVDRREERLLDLIPDAPSKPYDMRKCWNW